jgi:hypothetical protein
MFGPGEVAERKDMLRTLIEVARPINALFFKPQAPSPKRVGGRIEHQASSIQYLAV